MESAAIAQMVLFLSEREDYTEFSEAMLTGPVLGECNVRVFAKGKLIS